MICLPVLDCRLLDLVFALWRDDVGDLLADDVSKLVLVKILLFVGFSNVKFISNFFDFVASLLDFLNLRLGHALSFCGFLLLDRLILFVAASDSLLLFLSALWLMGLRISSGRSFQLFLVSCTLL